MMPSDYYKGLLVAVDPGLRGCGVAYFKNGVLNHAEYVTNPNKLDRGPVAHLQMAETVAQRLGQFAPAANAYKPWLLVEFPRIYPGPGKNVDPNDLLDVAGVASAVVVCVANWFDLNDASCRYVMPFEWKGNIKKEIMTNRISASLTAHERGVIVSIGAKDHNTIDAVGIGLWQLGRLQRKVMQ